MSPSTAAREHRYAVELHWSGPAVDAAAFRRHRRAFEISAPGKPTLAGSSDPVFRGEADRWNPEDLLVASLSSCHQLWFMGLCASAGIVVRRYVDEAIGVMLEESAGGAGQFVRVELRPLVAVADRADLARAQALHERAHASCFIARSVNFPVIVSARTIVSD